MSVDWGAVYEDTAEDLVRFLYRKVWNLATARDLVQETFVRALDNEPKDPKAWLFTVARNLARDEARREIRRRDREEALRIETETPGSDPAQELDRGLRVSRIRKALATLSERDREALLLRDAGFGYAEIAAQTGLASGSVGTTLSRARRRFVGAYEALEES